MGLDNLSLGVSRTRVAISKEGDRRPLSMLPGPMFPQTRRKRICHDPLADILCNVIPAKGRAKHSNMYFNVSTE